MESEGTQHLSRGEIAAILKIGRTLWRDNRNAADWAAARQSADAIDELLDEIGRRQECEDDPDAE